LKERRLGRRRGGEGGALTPTLFEF
jgi:hypothetical protein